MSYMIAENLTKIYGNGETAVSAIRDISFQIGLGEFISIMDESGAGKSTLLSVMGAMNAPTSGKFTVDDIDVYRLTSEQQADFRREFLGFVFQSFHLVPYLSVEENVMLPLAITQTNRKQKRAMVAEALTRVGLKDKGRRLPNQISGGEKERVAVARAIVNEPPVLLADEPTGNLDTKTTHEIMALLQRLHENGMTIVMVTHSPECASYAQRTLQVSDGLLMENDERSRCYPHKQRGGIL
jgi:putative ABC transport system ATP-binding protein